MKVKTKKAAIESDYFGWLVIAVIFGVVAILGILILKGKWSSAIDYIRNIFRFGG